MPANKDPGLVFEHAVAGPGTHVLIVGIGTYPALLGGKNENPAVAEGMDQLDAPPISAISLARWFLESFDNVEKPLASLSLVVSAPKPAAFDHPSAVKPPSPLPKGTADEVEAAIAAWLQRGSTNKENQVVFFFSGHGVSASDSILLLRDFGAKPQNRFDGALNLNDFVGAMQTMLPEYQLFLVDACRVPTSLARSVLGKPRVGRPMLTPQDLDVRGGSPAKQSVHHSSSTLEPSWGRLKGASLYTEALVQALDGGGAQADLGYWVGTPGLQTALAAYTPRLARKEKVEQQPEILRSVKFKIHRPRQISIPLYVTCNPREALRSARIEARQQNKVNGVYDSAQGPLDEWMVVLPMREHNLFATFAAHTGYEDETALAVVAPPETVCEPIQCRKRP